ncbi:5070_t:CDS:2, partial [Racocetra fulgida]
AADTLSVVENYDSNYYPPSNFHTDHTLNLDDDFRLVSLFEPSTACILPASENVDDSISEMSGSDNESEDKSNCIECGFTLNTTYRKCTDLVYVNKFTEEHSHKLNNSELIQQFSPLSRKIPTNIKEKIRFYVQECQLGATLQTGIELRLKDEVKYAKFQELRNINPTAGLPHVSNTIFKKIDKGLLLFDKNQESSVQLVQSDDIPISSNTFQALEKICEQEINNKAAVDSDSKKVLYGHGLGICKKALNLAIMNGTNKALEDVLQQFI